MDSLSRSVTFSLALHLLVVTYMDVNWSRVFRATLIYAAGSLLGLAFVMACLAMAGLENPNSSWVTSYMISMLPALNSLQGDRGNRTNIITLFAGSVLILLTSLSAYVAVHFSPELIQSPHLGPLGALLAMVIHYAVFWLTNPQLPNENA